LRQDANPVWLVSNEAVAEKSDSMGKEEPLIEVAKKSTNKVSSKASLAFFGLNVLE
jgi:hypothetical protein